MYLVGPGNSLDVSVTFPSFTFPLRFRNVSVSVSVTFPSPFRRASVNVSVAFPLGKCLPEGNSPNTHAPYSCVFWPRAALQIPSKTCFGKVVPTSSLNLRSRLRTPRSTFSGRARRYLADSDGSERQMRRGPKGRINSNVLQRFHHVSVNVSATFPSTFPQRFRQRFQRVSVNVSVVFPLGKCVPDGNYPETLPTFPGYIYIYIYMYICIHIYTYTCIYIYISIVDVYLYFHELHFSAEIPAIYVSQWYPR